MSDILTYKPRIDWNEDVINFGMPTNSGNLRLTEICLNAQDCLTATKGAMELSFEESNFEAARTPPVLKVVRTLFGADTGIEIETSAAVYETHDIETYVEGVGPSLADVDWLVDIGKDVDIAIKLTTELVSNNVHDVQSNRKDVWNPRGFSFSTGTRSAPGNWDIDGEPWFSFSWNAITHQHCSDGTSTNYTDCWNHYYDGYCRTPEHRTEDVVSMTYSGGEVVPYDTTTLVRQTTNQYCLQGQYSPQYGGRCHYSSNWGQSWNWYGSNWTKETCLEYTQTVGGWNNLWWYWSDDGNTWTSIYHNWFPSNETIASWKEFRVKTAASHRIWPKDHMTTVSNSVTIYQNDNNASYGNGTEVGRAFYPMWIANVFDWPDYENMYATPVDVYLCSNQNMVCTDTQWTNEPDCLNHGTCSNAAFDNQPLACLGEGTCSNASWDNDEVTCLAQGTCVGMSIWNNNEVACTGNGGTFATAGYTFTSAGNTWSSAGHHWQLEFPDQATCEAASHTWDFSHTEPSGATVIPTKEVEIPIDEDYWMRVSMPAHGFVGTNQSQSRPTGQYGYQGNSSLVDSSKIRWLPPMYNYSNWQHAFMRPTKFRIYRSPYFSPNGLTLTDSDYEANIWKLAGEVPCTSPNGYHYFYDSREDMFNEGLDAYQDAMYGVTAVWENWNWKRGYTVQRYNNVTHYDWDIYSNSWANIDYFEGMTPNDTWETNKININDNTNNRTHRVSGYMKAPYTGQYRFWLNSDDAMYVWKGSPGESVESILTWRTWYNATVDEPGNHGARSEYSNYFNLNQGDIVPILMYHGQSWGSMTLQFQIWYESTTWDNGLYNTGGWHYTPIYIMPQSGNANGVCSVPQYTDQAQCSANSGTWTSPGNAGQTVEGHWSSQNVPSNYRN